MADDEDNDLQIVEDNTSLLELNFWDEDLSPAQKAAEETVRKTYERYKELKKNILHCRKSGSLELWTKKPQKLAVLNGVNQVSRVANVGNKTFQAVPVSGMTTSPISRINYIGTSPTGVQLRPNISGPRQLRPTLSDAQSAAQQRNQSNLARSLSSVPQLQNLMFDPQSGLILQNQGGYSNTNNQGGVMRSPVIRQAAVPVNVGTKSHSAAVLPINLPNARAINATVGGSGSNAKMSPVIPKGVQSSPIVSKQLNTLPIKTVSIAAPPKQNVVPRQQGGSESSRNISAVQLSMNKANPMSNSGNISIGAKVQNIQYTPAGEQLINGGKLPLPGVSSAKPPQSGSSASNSPNPSDTNNNNNNLNNSKTFPSLVVTVKPCLHNKPTKQELNASRAELDQTVKNALVNTPSKFTEWLMMKGLLRLEHKCYIHTGQDGLPMPMKLGMYPDKDTETFSGGYVWVADCCSGRQISVFDGSIFDPSNHPPMTILKLIYHWACQTSASNVMNWCKVSGGYLKNFYTLLRSICVGALHELCPFLGGQGKLIEVGLITLGTAYTAPAGKRQFQIEILGVFDPESKIIRMKVINPPLTTATPTEASKTRNTQIVTPLTSWVNKSSKVLIDGSIELSLLMEAGFSNVIRCKSATDEGYDATQPTNINVMNYLKHVVPKMFQSTLCVLSKSLIQQFLDELSWREIWGKSASQAFDMMLDHIKTMTNWDFGPSGSLIGYLNKISMNPFQDWSYTKELTQKTLSGIDLLPESIRCTSATASYQIEGMKRATNGYSNNATLNRSTKLDVTPTNSVSVKRKVETTVSGLVEYYNTQAKSLVLESFYYAEVPPSVDDPCGEFPQNIKCPLCSKPLQSNLDVYRHIYSHVNTVGRAVLTSNYCMYCYKEMSASTLPSHIEEVHKTKKPNSCRICQERFPNELAFVIHMWENHNRADTPYSCNICAYKTSFHYQAVDHYNEMHCGKDSVLCPLCMEVLPARSPNCLQEITVHIQVHQARKGKKCPSCCLQFCGPLECQVHVSKCHLKEGSGVSTSPKPITYRIKNEEGTLMAKPPQTAKTYLQSFTVNPQKKRKPNTYGSDKVPAYRSSVIAEDECTLQEFKVVMHGATDTDCLECTKKVEDPNHYPGHMRCMNCRFATCCRQAMRKHHSQTHPADGKGSHYGSIKVKPTELMEKALLCQCGFESINPNRLARHLAKCEKTTAFPPDWEEQQKANAEKRIELQALSPQLEPEQESST